MAKPLPISQDMVKALWLQGLQPKEIEQQTGVKRATQRSWITRNGWKRDRGQLATSKEAAQTAAAQDVAKRLNTMVIDQAERLVRCIQDNKVKTLSDAKTAGSALASSYATARKALGLDDTERTSAHLHIHVMKSAQSRIATAAELSTLPNATAASPVIDADVVSDTTAAGATAASSSPE